jgi:hypothetical protein
MIDLPGSNYAISRGIDILLIFFLDKFPKTNFVFIYYVLNGFIIFYLG